MQFLAGFMCDVRTEIHKQLGENAALQSSWLFSCLMFKCAACALTIPGKHPWKQARMQVDVCYTYVSHKWKCGRASQVEQNKNSGFRSHIINPATIMCVIQQPTHTDTHAHTHTFQAWIISQSLRLEKQYCPQGCYHCVHVWVWVCVCVASCPSLRHAASLMQWYCNGCAPLICGDVRHFGNCLCK